MTLTPIDRIIGREVGRLFWHILPEVFPGIKVDEEAFRPIWDLREPEELRAVREENPLVEYPVLYLGIDVIAGLAPSPFLYPPRFGDPLRLSDYLGMLRRFLILQLTGNENRHVQIIWYAVRSLAAHLSTEELLKFVDELWCGRWIVGAAEWSYMRRSILSGGTDEGIAQLQSDASRLQSEALRIIQAERMLKASARSMDEWLHECYCLLPDVYTWGLTIAWANDILQSDELGKFDRVLDEFQADIGTTLTISCTSLNGGETLADCYAIKPLMENATIEDAIAFIRGIYRGRTIIPRVWYEQAKEAIGRIRDKTFERRPWFVRQADGESSLLISEDDYSALNTADAALAFGWCMTLYTKADNWLTLGSLFDYWEESTDS